jgi:hypothetical protein
MLKIQQLDPDFGWVFTTRAGPTHHDAERMLAGYRRDYPRDKYRLVDVDDDGRVKEEINAHQDRL